MNLRGRLEYLGVADVAAHDLVDRRGGIEDLVERFAGQGRTEDDARAVTARFGGLEPDGFEALPDLRDVLDFDPVELNVLTVRQVGGVPAEFLRDTGDGAQLLDVQSAGVATHAHHEVLGLEQVDVLVAGEGAVVAFFALGVETPTSGSGREGRPCRCCRSPAWSRCSRCGPER